jgi:hypothetical protein
MEWIKCSDRLPENDIFVLGYNKEWPNEIEDECEVIRICHRYCLPWVPGEPDIDGWYVEAIRYFNSDKLSSPTHWMPLPKDPDAKEKDS